jgi:uncharacterized protein YbjT (DUF2867 family)
MKSTGERIVVVTGVTGLQGGAVTRHLLKEGWRVRGLTRNPESEKARGLSALGAEVVRADLNDPASLRPVFEGAYGVYSVQNPFIGGPEAEVRQGRNVGDAAKESGVQHFVYGSAGTGKRGTGIPSWETKLQVEEHLKGLELPITILRPMAFMELLTEKKFFPQVSTWHVMPKVMGLSRSLPWLCTDDLGAVAAIAFSDPQRFIGQELVLASDVKSLEECRTLHREVMGKNPSRFPMPIWVFKRFGFMGRDLMTMWGWLRTGDVALETAPTREIHPDALTVREWLGRQKGA